MDVQEIKKVGVIGAGVMGHGIAQIFAQHGYPTILVSRREETLSEALREIRSNLTRFVEHKIISEDAIEKTISMIATSTKLEKAMVDTDFVVEAVFEDINIKRSVFKSLESVCPPNTILATNTSGLSITEIASAATKPGRIVGTHFWNPPYIMPLVEVTKGDFTSLETFETTYKMMERVGKVPVKILKDIPGFIGNRIQHAMYREIFSLLDQKVATAEDIDKVVTLTFGGRLSILGPLTIADLNGVQLFLEVQNYLLKYIDRSTNPARILNEMVKKGYIGIKTGRGFYTWNKEKINEVTKKRDDNLMRLYKPYLQGST
jgi:3-hydroxybutyryl-CoA dehydrogenase